jgi:hypothetical protein
LLGETWALLFASRNMGNILTWAFNVTNNLKNPWIPNFEGIPAKKNHFPPHNET